MVNSAITARGLQKAYGDKTVLDGIDITVAEGTVFSLLGPNGAGKTTSRADPHHPDRRRRRRVHGRGHDVATDRGGVRELIGVTGQFAAVDRLTDRSRAR